MTTPTTPQKPSKALLWTGRILSAIPVLFMAGLGSVFLITNPSMITDGMIKYGYPKEAAFPIVIIEIVCALIYAIPQTATLGAILLTGYLGGAVATHVHAAEYVQIPFPLLFGILVWLGLLLREPRLRALLSVRR
jgi:hypothetical protein